MFKRIKKSDNYKYVSLMERENGRPVWVADLRVANSKLGQSYHETEREAAKAIDLKLIEFHKEPINVLVRK